MKTIGGTAALDPWVLSMFPDNTYVNRIDGFDIRVQVEYRHGKVWNTRGLSKDFEILSFSAPEVTVRRKSDGVRGTVFFNQHSPRFYYNFQETKDVETHSPAQEDRQEEGR